MAVVIAHGLSPVPARAIAGSGVGERARPHVYWTALYVVARRRPTQLGRTLDDCGSRLCSVSARRCPRRRAVQVRRWAYQGATMYRSDRFGLTVGVRVVAGFAGRLDAAGLEWE